MSPIANRSRRVRIVCLVLFLVVAAFVPWQRLPETLRASGPRPTSIKAVLPKQVQSLGAGFSATTSAEPAYDPVCEENPEQCAYTAMLCDDELIPALRVLIYSLRQTGTLHPIVVLVLPHVTAAAQQELWLLADDVVPVDQLAYPYEKKVKLELGINKQCRYSKLHLWAQTQYKSLIYLDVDTAVVKNIDHLFSTTTTFAGVKDLGDVINTGVLVFKPSQATFNDMMDTYLTAPSYNRGDQGFLNWYFTNHSTTGVTVLGPAYNVPAKLKGFAIGKQLIDNAFVYHYTAETKPWSFHHFYHRDWRINYHPRMFAKWRALDYEVAQTLPELKDSFALPRQDLPLRRDLANYEWPNLHRQYEICSRYNPRYETEGKFPIQKQYSVAISFYNPERLGYLPKLIRHYLLSELVHTVYITWHSKSVPVTDELKALVDGGRVKILPMTSDTLNNRFNPIPGLKTQAVFICDDDIFAPITGIDFLFRVWQARPDSIAGFFPRIHGRKEDGSIFYEMAGVHHKYDIILTKAMMINANFLHAFTCVLPPEIHRYIDYGKNCEDIAMNMMVSGLTGAAPVCVHEDEVLDFGTGKGISITPAFTMRRDTCTSDLIDLFGRDTLVESTEYVRKFGSNKFRKVPWEELDSILETERQKVLDLGKK
ncbi:uncharacterized protein JCM10292_007082 [Rhodotorula paludigena]|uniref:uncharacterized protein n=1 Tax=Rhodotorula paludigena TaxID=86838 RepID=UPI00317D02FF